MTAYDRYCYSVGKAIGEVSRVRFDAVYTFLAKSFCRTTGRSDVPVEADTVVFMYVSQFMQQADKGTFTSERLGDYTYIRTNATIAEMLVDYTQAIQEYAVSGELPIGIATGGCYDKCCCR